MASDDDMNDNSSSNEDVTFISDDEDVTFISDDDDDRDQNINKKYNLLKKYKILKAEDRKVCQQDNISEISNLFSIKRHEACTVLLNYGWHVDKITQDWFSDEYSVRRSVGLLETPLEVDKQNPNRKTDCGICFDSYQIDKIVATPCAHSFCYTCWSKYISVAITDGPGCLFLKCPTPKCRLAVGIDMIFMLSSENDKKKYNKYLEQSYVENHYKKNMKWCPGPGCDYVIEYDLENKRSSYDCSSYDCSSYDVTCLCSYQSCWNCREDAHSPVACDIVAKWVLKNKDESENTTWMLANTKPCPKCKRAIEKNQGCNHMTCKAPCRFEFCWVCLGDWSKHSGGNYRCNHYSGKTKEEDKREMAKKFIERYPHYYVRWKTNEESRKKALEDLKKSKENCEKKQGNEWKVPSGDLKFIQEAWLQVAECRRVLKWTYAYGYYIRAEEVAKIQFFEYLQGEAEAGLERLHHCVETELINYIGLAKNPNDQEFYDFRRKLVNLTSVTRNYFDNLVKALENGLSEVNM